MKLSHISLFIPLLALIILQVACSSKINQTAETPSLLKRKQAPLLERSYAMARSQHVNEVKYQLEIKLSADNEPFTGVAIVDFNLSDNAFPLSLDFVGGEVNGVTLDNKDIPYQYNGNFIQFTAGTLKTGTNSLTIRYTNNYRRDGKGLHWFKDPEDGNAYVFTQFEPWDFNKVFPGFDQPDIKARYTLKVDAPADWQVISAMRETKVEESAANRKTWYFPQSPLISTYIFSLHAGPYIMWQEQQPFRVPLRLFARQSYAKHVDVDEWFKVSRQGFDFFEGYFKTPYPYSKYDQILVPEMPFGAMENLGAVTFNERLQPRREKTLADRQLMSIVVQHELAHHWFGNLVTMRWWDDLWLNESFADLMGNFATSEATEYKDAMTLFSSSRKSWGYEEDLAVTTHPIMQTVTDTSSVAASIDGITYAKGAAVLIQLKHLIGEEMFSNSLAHYFAKHAQSNTSISDFIAAFENTAKRDLGAWSESWLEKSGVNTLKASFSCENNLLQSLDIQQFPANNSGAIREHKLDILLVDHGGKRTIIDALIKEGNNSVAAANTYPCPAFVLPNVSDYAFVGVLFDELSIAYLNQNIAHFNNDLEKGMIWRNLYETVKKGNYAANEFIDLILTQMQSETNPSILASQETYLKNAYKQLAIRPAIYPDGEMHSQAEERKGKYKNKIAAIAYKEFNKNEGANKNIWLDIWLYSLHSKQDINRLQTLLSHKNLSIDKRWNMVKTLMSLGNLEAKTWIEALANEDKSSAAELSRFTAEAQENDREKKLYWINEAANAESSYSFHQLRSVLKELFTEDQHSLRLALKPTILERLKQANADLNDKRLQLIANLLPQECTKKSEQAIWQLASSNNFGSLTNKSLRKLSQDEGICRIMQEKLSM